MSQVDYVHYFNNICWSFVQFIGIYILVCSFYVQVFYKIFRLRSAAYVHLVYLTRKTLVNFSNGKINYYFLQNNFKSMFSFICFFYKQNVNLNIYTFFII